MKALIADDSHVYRRTLEQSLTDWGYDVIAVADGQAAWEILRSEHSPKIAVLDWQMPGLDGLEVCRKVRTLLRPEPTYILMLTLCEPGPRIPWRPWKGGRTIT